MRKPDFLHGILNLKQWLDYSRIFTFPAFFFLQILSTIGVVLMYMGMVGDFGLLLKLTFPIFLVLIGVGYVFFIREVQPTDLTMQQWRNVWIQFINTALLQMLTDLAVKEDFPIPEYFSDWGLKSWLDLGKLIQFVLSKGKKIKAHKLIKEFLENV